MRCSVEPGSTSTYNSGRVWDQKCAPLRGGLEFRGVNWIVVVFCHFHRSLVALSLLRAATLWCGRRFSFFSSFVNTDPLLSNSTAFQAPLAHNKNKFSLHLHAGTFSQSTQPPMFSCPLFATDRTIRPHAEGWTGQERTPSAACGEARVCYRDSEANPDAGRPATRPQPSEQWPESEPSSGASRPQPDHVNQWEHRHV